MALKQSTLNEHVNVESLRAYAARLNEQADRERDLDELRRECRHPDQQIKQARG